MSGPTRVIGRRIGSTPPDVIDDGARVVVSGLIHRTLTAANRPAGDAGSSFVQFGVDLLADAHELAAGLGAEPRSEQTEDLMGIAAPVLGASLATAVRYPCSGAGLGAAVLAGCELGLLLGEMVGSGGGSRLNAAAATCAAVSAARVLDLRGDQLVSAIGIGASSSVGAASVPDRAWQAGKSASNGVLAALLAGAGFTGPTDAIEHPRGLLGTVFGVAAPAGMAAALGSRIHAMEPLVASARPADGPRTHAAALWQMESVSELLTTLPPKRRWP